jgi:hypothetical protein
MLFEMNGLCLRSRWDFVWYASRKTVGERRPGIQLHSRILIVTQGDNQMNIQKVKKYAISFALAAGFVIVPGLSNLSTVQAQWGRGRYDRYDRRGDRREEQKGFRDGLDRGQKDAKTNRRADPNNSQHYREGNRDYREGFRSGYFQGYRQYARYGRRY